jgi:ribosomal protein S18 acetylase RimI-like enzyme
MTDADDTIAPELTACQQPHPITHSDPENPLIFTSVQNNVEETFELVQPEPCDFPSLCDLKALAFAEKGASARTARQAFQTYSQNYPAKLCHCRIVRLVEPSKRVSGSGLEGSNRIVVVGVIQLMCPGDAPDLEQPYLLQHHKLCLGEVHLECLATHPQYARRGIASHLLRWAEQFARASGTAFISLEVMTSNTNAIRLYERHGYIVPSEDPHGVCCSAFEWCESFYYGLLVFCCLRCRYWSELYMEKRLEPCS